MKKKIRAIDKRELEYTAFEIAATQPRIPPLHSPLVLYKRCQGWLRKHSQWCYKLLMHVLHPGMLQRGCSVESLEAEKWLPLAEVNPTLKSYNVHVSLLLSACCCFLFSSLFFFSTGNSFCIKKKISKRQEKRYTSLSLRNLQGRLTVTLREHFIFISC